MPQIFHPAMNAVARGSLIVAAGGALGGIWLALAIARSPYATQADVVRDQPIPFSHQHHVEQVGLDCRFCHAFAETSAFAGMPATETCMGCHREIWADSPVLEPVRVSYQQQQPIRWTRVHDLPDFVYFNIIVHVTRGIACATCHGRVEQMPLMQRKETLHMEWCLRCHRHPPSSTRSTPETPDGDAANEITRLTNCSVCHR